MSPLIDCHYLKKSAPALPGPPYPGTLGQWLHAHISAPAWSAWLTEQTKLINEERLNLAKPEARLKIEQALCDFFQINRNEVG